MEVLKTLAKDLARHLSIDEPEILLEERHHFEYLNFVYNNKEIKIRFSKVFTIWVNGIWDNQTYRLQDFNGILECIRRRAK
ncbi:MAG: hypothetical protein KGI50_07865 [Patescibacteria group bacterium]|nr:hypothetical protein [Patescibacteria group bacterium]MDE2438915.1 hypothetical protein [Patescibacteria group bacterium]